MGEFGMRWRISVCLHFNTQGTVIDMIGSPMVYIRSHGEEILEDQDTEINRQ